MARKEIVVMDKQAFEAQGVAALGKRRKILKTFEVVRRDMTRPRLPRCRRLADLHRWH